MTKDELFEFIKKTILRDSVFYHLYCAYFLIVSEKSDLELSPDNKQFKKAFENFADMGADIISNKYYAGDPSNWENKDIKCYNRTSVILHVLEMLDHVVENNE